MFVRFTGGGIGHQNTALSTRIFRDALLKLFGFNLNDNRHNPSNDQVINNPDLDDGDSIDSEDGSDAPEYEEWEDIDDIDDDIDNSDFEDHDGGECGVDEEDELGFGSF